MSSHKTCPRKNELRKTGISRNIFMEYFRDDLLFWGTWMSNSTSSQHLTVFMSKNELVWYMHRSSGKLTNPEQPAPWSTFPRQNKEFSEVRCGEVGVERFKLNKINLRITMNRQEWEWLPEFEAEGGEEAQPRTCLAGIFIKATWHIAEPVAILQTTFRSFSIWRCEANEVHRA